MFKGAVKNNELNENTHAGLYVGKNCVAVMDETYDCLILVDFFINVV